MKIGLLLPSIYFGKKYKKRVFAPGELLLSLANELVKKGHEVFLYCAEGPKVDSRIKIIAGNRQLLSKNYPTSKFRGFDKAMFKVATRLVTQAEYEIDLTSKALLDAQEKHLDILHSYHDFYIHYLSKLVKTPVCYTIHDPKPRKNTLDFWRLKHFPNDNYIAISKSQVCNHKDLINFTEVIYHGVDLANFSFYPSVDKNPYLIFLGRYLKVKGVDVAVAVSEKLMLPLKLAGSSNYKSLDYYQKQIKPHIKNGLISETGYLNPQKRNEFFKNAKALLFPIRWEEPFGMVVIEAMACGIPVIGFDRGAVPELVVDGETGYLVNPEKGTEGFISAVKKLYELPEEEYLKMRQNCRKHVEKNFTSEKMAENYERVYQRIVKVKH